MTTQTLTQEQFDRKMRRYERINQAIAAGFWYERPGDGNSFISWRLYHRDAPWPDKCIGEYQSKRSVEGAMVRRAGVK